MSAERKGTYQILIHPDGRIWAIGLEYPAPTDEDEEEPPTIWGRPERRFIRLLWGKMHQADRQAITLETAFVFCQVANAYPRGNVLHTEMAKRIRAKERAGFVSQGDEPVFQVAHASDPHTLVHRDCPFPLNASAVPVASTPPIKVVSADDDTLTAIGIVSIGF